MNIECRNIYTQLEIGCCLSSRKPPEEYNLFTEDGYYTSYETNEKEISDKKSFVYILDSPWS